MLASGIRFPYHFVMASMEVKRNDASCEANSVLRKRSKNASSPAGFVKLEVDTQRKTVLVPEKYRHVAAVHTRQRTSCLSQDSDATTSFLGFRNLMVLVLSRSSPILIL